MVIKSAKWYIGTVFKKSNLPQWNSANPIHTLSGLLTIQKNNSITDYHPINAWFLPLIYIKMRYHKIMTNARRFWMNRKGVRSDRKSVNQQQPLIRPASLMLSSYLVWNARCTLSEKINKSLFFLKAQYDKNTYAEVISVDRLKVWCSIEFPICNWSESSARFWYQFAYICLFDQDQLKKKIVSSPLVSRDGHKPKRWCGLRSFEAHGPNRNWNSLTRGVSMVGCSGFKPHLLCPQVSPGET